MRLADLIGVDPGEVEARLGVPDAERRTPGERWMVYRRDGATLRVRCGAAANPASGDGGPSGGDGTGRVPGEGVAEGDVEDGGPDAAAFHVASWTLTWDEPRDSLRRAVEPLGLWPACAPDVEARAVDGPMVRRALPADGETPHSLTAGVGDGGFVRVAAFDEPPEWE